MAELEALLARAVDEPVLLHPNMAEVYRVKFARLDSLNDEHDRTEAAETIRGLVDRIVLTPKGGGRPQGPLDRSRGCAGGQRPLGNKMVAGAYTHRQFALPAIFV
jgi:hypothetical protein